MSTVTPKAKPSVSSVATPSFMLRGGVEGGGGGALDRVEEGGGSADCTDGGDGGVGAGALLGHARQTKVRQPRLAARVEKDVARLDLHAVQQAIGAHRCGSAGACLRQGFPVGRPILPSVLTATHLLGAATSPCSRTGCCACRCTSARAASRRMVSRCSHVSGAGSSAQPSAARRPNPALLGSSRSSSVPPAHSGYTRQGCRDDSRQ
eukprot:scaffold12780_cov67-Phaeocystis_antarctica.AAC.2